MTILHIAKLKNNKTNGVFVAVPEHIISQGKFEKIYFYNINDDKIDGLEDYQIYVDNKKNAITTLMDKIGNCDLVIFHEVNNIDYIRMYRTLVSMKIPYIILPHGEICQQALNHKWFKKKVAYLLLFNKFLRHAKAVQSLSNNEDNAIKIKTPPRFVGGNGVNMPTVSKSDFNHDCVKIVYVGRLNVNVKGLDLLVEAVSIQKTFCIDNNLSINIYGPDDFGRAAQVGELIAKHDVADIVRLNSPITGEDKQKVLLDSDLFIQASRFEGLPLGVLESMSYGLPCILTVGTNLSQSSQTGASYYAGTTVQDIATAIVNAVNDRQNWTTVSQNAIDYIKDNYTWDKISQENLAKYKTIISQ